MTALLEQNLIDRLAVHCGNISGISNAYGFAANPDTLSLAQLPAVLFYPMRLNVNIAGHHGIHTNELTIRGSVLVIPRMAQGGKLKHIENNAISLMPSFRLKFQDSAIIQDLLTQGCQKALMETIQYGSGGIYLTHAGVEYVGLIVDWQFKFTV